MITGYIECIQVTDEQQLDSNLHSYPCDFEIDRLYLRAVEDKRRTYSISWLDALAGVRFSVSISCGESRYIQWQMRSTNGALDQILWTEASNDVTPMIRRIKQSYLQVVDAAKKSRVHGVISLLSFRKKKRTSAVE